MNKITILAISAVFVASMIAITAFEAEAKPPAQAICPAENVQYWETWSFRYSGVLTHLINPTIPTSQPELLKFKADPTIPYFPRATIVDRLIELGYTDSATAGGIPTEANLSTHTFQSSTIICAEN